MKTVKVIEVSGPSIHLYLFPWFSLKSLMLLMLGGFHLLFQPVARWGGLILGFIWFYLNPRNFNLRNFQFLISFFINYFSLQSATPIILISKRFKFTRVYFKDSPETSGDFPPTVFLAQNCRWYRYNFYDLQSWFISIIKNRLKITFVENPKIPRIQPIGGIWLCCPISEWCQNRCLRRGIKIIRHREDLCIIDRLYCIIHTTPTSCTAWCHTTCYKSHWTMLLS